MPSSKRVDGEIRTMKETVLKVVDLKKWFQVRTGLRSMFSKRRLFVRAVDGVSFEIKKGEVFGLVGESGSGKTTTGRALLRLTDVTSGKIYFCGKDISTIPDKELKQLRRKMQIVFQDPYDSLNPRMSIGSIVAEPLSVQKLGSDAEIRENVIRALEDVQLIPPEEFLYRFPHELSGGQRQRVAVARALIVDPEFLVADEPVSMLDVSIRAEILNLMLELVRKFNVSFLYITHDLALARHMCDSIAVMYLGKIMEMGSTEKVVYEPLHPYTKALISAVPVPDPTSKRSEVVLSGEIPSPISPPPGCRFQTRCPSKIGTICSTKEPTLIDVGDNHYVACHKLS